MAKKKEIPMAKAQERLFTKVCDQTIDMLDELSKTGKVSKHKHASTTKTIEKLKSTFKK